MRPFPYIYIYKDDTKDISIITPLIYKINTRGDSDKALRWPAKRLATFQRTGRQGAPLSGTETLYFVLAKQLPPELCDESQKCRSCVRKSQDGSSQLELCRGLQHEVHSLAARGSVGWTMAVWLHHLGSINGTHANDYYAHGHHNFWKRTSVNSNLWLCVLAWSSVANITRNLM